MKFWQRVLICRLPTDFVWVLKNKLKLCCNCFTSFVCVLWNINSLLGSDNENNHAEIKPIYSICHRCFDTFYSDHKSERVTLDTQGICFCLIDILQATLPNSEPANFMMPHIIRKIKHLIKNKAYTEIAIHKDIQCKIKSSASLHQNAHIN